MAGILVKWMLAIAMAVMAIFGSLSSAFACDPAAYCSSYIVERDGMPYCLELLNGHGWEEREECAWEMTVSNECDEDVEFVEINCDSECADTVVVEAGEESNFPLTMPEEEGFVEQDFRWSLGDSDGEMLTRADHSPYEGDPCSGRVCQQSSTGSPSGALVIVTLMMSALWWRNRSSLTRSVSG